MKTIRYELDGAGIATLTFDQPDSPVNTMTPQWRLDLAAAALQLLADKGAKIDVWNRPNKGGLTPLVIAEGHRPGLNFRPSPPTVAALHRVMLAAGVPVPKSPPLPANLVEPAYGGKQKTPGP